MMRFTISLPFAPLSKEQVLEVQRLQRLLARAILHSPFKDQLTNCRYDYSKYLRCKPFDLMIKELNERLEYVENYTEKDSVKRSQPEPTATRAKLTRYHELVGSPESLKRPCYHTEKPPERSHACSSTALSFPDELLTQRALRSNFVSVGPKRQR